MARGHLKPERWGLPMSQPITNGPVIDEGRVILSIQLLDVIELLRGQTLAIVKPPVEPPPEKWGESGLGCKGNDDAEPVGRLR